ncbi:hypothetical protein Tco_0433719, partial [Tanacetum coccineum]
MEYSDCGPLRGGCPTGIGAGITTATPAHIADAYPEELEEDPEEDPADYPADGGDDNNEPSRDDAEDEDEEEAFKEE